MRVVIIGVGAMGSLFAARLNGSVDLTLLGNWPEQLAALAGDGLRLVHLDGHETRHFLKATDQTSDLEKADLALILVKGWQTTRAARQAAQILQPDGIALTLQNGLGNLEIIIEEMGIEQAALGVTSEGATMVGPGLVRHAGTGITHLATTPSTEDRLAEVAVLFQQAGFQTHLVNNATTLVWGKLAINAGINPITGLLQVPNGFLAVNDEARLLMCQAAEEAAAVAAAQGVALPYASASQRAIEVARATATNRSSMAQDVARGMPTEIDSICGAIIRLGEAYGVATPVNQAFYRLVKSQVSTGDWLSEIENLPEDLRISGNMLARLEREL